jgi:hypothetical protein
MPYVPRTAFMPGNAPGDGYPDDWTVPGNPRGDTGPDDWTCREIPAAIPIRTIGRAAVARNAGHGALRRLCGAVWDSHSFEI